MKRDNMIVLSHQYLGDWGGGESLGNNYYVRTLRYGRCSCLLHMQMVGQRGIKATNLKV